MSNESRTEKMYRTVFSEDRNPEKEGRYFVIVNSTSENPENLYADFWKGRWWIDDSDYTDAKIEWLEEIPMQQKTKYKMIKTNELRIGNWLMGNMPVQVKTILCENTVGLGEGGPYYVYVEAPYKPCLEPITLTPEILEKCGFKFKEGLINNDPNHKMIYWIGYNNTKVFYLEVSKKGFVFLSQSLLYVKYLHQLQNLYFSLTGKELEVNL